MQEEGDRTWQWGLGLLGGVVLLVLLAVFWGWPKLQERGTEKALSRASELIASKDYRQAQLLYEQVVQLHPDHFQARRLLADFYALGKSPEALFQWREVARREPGNDANWLGLANTALQFGDLKTVREAVAGVSSAGRTQIDYKRYVAALALAEGDKVALRAALLDLVQSDPANVRARFNLAALDILSARAEDRGAARQELEKLARTGPMQIKATLVLLRLMEAGRLSVTITEVAQAVLPAKNGAGLDDLVKHMQAQPDPSSQDAADLCRWLQANGRGVVALAWIETLPEATRSHPVILSVWAECAASARDWPVLKKTLEAGAWGVLPPSLVDHAFAAQDIRQEGGSAAAEAEAKSWQRAIDAAGKSVGSLQVLVRLAHVFSWMEQLEVTLARIVVLKPEDQTVRADLIAVAESLGEADAALEHYRNWARTPLAASSVKARTALLGVLVGSVDAPTREWLTDETLKTEPAMIAARALRSYQLGSRPAALEMIQGLSQPVASYPQRVRLVVAYLLAGAGDTANSARWAAGINAAQLTLDEDIKLFNQIKNGPRQGVP
ncbi:hypothetical protein RAHE111665_08220 [Rariglobus hedericola]